MACRRYLAMTAAEFTLCSSLPENLAWMSCYFSLYGTGLSGFPSQLPKGTMLILSDRMPICGHDPDLITAQLKQRSAELECSAVLLDFQRPGSQEAAAVADAIVKDSCCPVGVSEPYAKDLDCPIFLPPIPLHVLPEEYLQPWQGREIWLDAALDGEIISINREGASYAPLTADRDFVFKHHNEVLCCHYNICVTPELATFTLRRTKEDLDSLANVAAKLGVSTTVSLFQEFTLQS